jgi:hypothetical protein
VTTRICDSRTSAAALPGLARQVREYCLEVWSAAVIGLVHAYDPSVAASFRALSRAAGPRLRIHTRREEESRSCRQFGDAAEIEPF